MGVVRRLKGVSVIEKVSTKVGNKLRRLRVQKNMTQQELADTLGLSVSAISSYELGVRVPSDKVKKQYSLYFNRSIEDLFF